jgi:SMC interacting uncharacterized protein involved in chromosome segregation
MSSIEGASQPISEYQDEQVKRIYNLVAEKKLKLEDAMHLLPESEVKKIKAITEKLEEKKKNLQSESIKIQNKADLSKLNVC